MPPKQEAGKKDKRAITSAQNIQKALQRRKQLQEEPELSDEMSDGEEEIIIQKKRGKQSQKNQNLELPPNDMPNTKLIEDMREEVFNLRKQLSTLTAKKGRKSNYQKVQRTPEFKKPEEYKNNQKLNDYTTVKKKEGKPTFELIF